MKRAMPPAVTQHPGAHSTKKERTKEKTRKREREREREKDRKARSQLCRKHPGTRRAKGAVPPAVVQHPGAHSKRKERAKERGRGRTGKTRRKRKKKGKVFPATTLRPRTHQEKSATSYDDASRYALEMETIAARLRKKRLSGFLETFSWVHGTYLLTTERLLTVL